MYFLNLGVKGLKGLIIDKNFLEPPHYYPSAHITYAHWLFHLTADDYAAPPQTHLEGSPTTLPFGLTLKLSFL